MKRLIAVTTLALAVVAVATPCSATILDYQQQRGESHRPCQYPWWRSVEARQRLISCLASVRDAPGSPSYVVGIARCESGPDLVAGVDRYAGTFQQLTSAWDERLRNFQSWAKVRPHYIPPTNVRWNTAVSIHMSKNDGTWSDQWSCAN